MRYSNLVVKLVSGLFCVAIALVPALAAGDEWKPVDVAEPSLKAPKVEKDADAEALIWETRIADELDGSDPRTVERHYVRIKVFTERGKEKHGKIDIPYFKNTRITDIAGRTIKADGTVVELKKDAIFDRTIVRTSGLKVNAKSFAMPAVEAGCIIEYRWREVHKDQISFFIRVDLQQDIPVRLLKFYVKPISIPGFPYGMRTLVLHGQGNPFIKEKDGFHSMTMMDVPAYREEPRMPPEYQIRTWMLVYYSEDKKLEAARFWKEYGKGRYEIYKPLLKPNDEVKRAALSAVGEAATPDQKLNRIYEFCRAKVKNISDDASGLSDDQLDKVKENKSPGDTLKRGMGTSRDIDLLFGAMAASLGFDVRVAEIADRSDIFFDPSVISDYFIDFAAIAVNVGDQWRFFRPGEMYVPYGMLPWEHEGQEALITDPKEPSFVATPLSPPEKSGERRRAKLRLSEDGTLEGDVRVEYYGHAAITRKEYDDDDSPEKREETLRDSLKSRMSTAEVSNIKIENVTDPANPFVYSFHIRVPGFAQRTGKRLFLQPAFFQKGRGALFTTSERRHPVYFHYPWSEQDEVLIDLPQGFSLDNADSPGPFAAGDSCKYDVKIGVDNRTLVYRRTFHFNGLVFPTSSYPGVKQVFDELHLRDNHTITLKQG